MGRKRPVFGIHATTTRRLCLGQPHVGGASEIEQSPTRVGRIGPVTDHVSG